MGKEDGSDYIPKGIARTSEVSCLSQNFVLFGKIQNAERKYFCPAFWRDRNTVINPVPEANYRQLQGWHKGFLVPEDEPDFREALG